MECSQFQPHSITRQSADRAQLVDRIAHDMRQGEAAFQSPVLFLNVQGAPEDLGCWFALFLELLCVFEKLLMIDSAG